MSAGKTMIQAVFNSTINDKASRTLRTRSSVNRIMVKAAFMIASQAKAGPSGAAPA